MGTSNVLKLANPVDGCSPFTNADDISSFVLVKRGGECHFADKVKNAQDVGARLVIIYNNRGDNLTRMNGYVGSITIPSVFISQSAGENLTALLSADKTIHPSVSCPQECS